MQKQTPTYLTSKQYCEKYQISLPTLWRKLNNNEIKYIDLAPKNSKKRLLRIIDEA